MAPPGSRYGIVGRGVEAALLASTLDELAGGRGRAVLLEGEPGIGKSALLAATVERARAAGIAVCAGEYDEAGRGLPVAVLLRAVGADGSDAASGVAVGADGSESAVVGEVAGAAVDVVGAAGWAAAFADGDPVAVAAQRVLAAVERRCAEGPLVLAVDDLHAGDEAGLLVWQRLSVVARRAPLLLFGTCRPVPRRPELDRLRRMLKDSDGVCVTLAPLDAADVAVLAGRVFGAPAGARLVERIESAGGNPLYLREILDALARAHAVEVRDGEAELVAADAGPLGATSRIEQQHPDLSDILAAAVADRIATLSEPCRDLLRAASLLGTAFTVTDLSRLLGRSAAGVAGAVQEAIVAGVLEASGAWLRFRHGVLRQVLYAAIPGSRRAELLRSAADALMENGSPVERVAELILGHPETIDGWAADWVADHAGLLGLRAPEAAAELCGRALDSGGLDPGRRAVLLESFAVVCFRLARYAQAIDLCRRLLDEITDPDLHGHAVWVYSYALTRTERFGEAERLVAAARADERISPIWRARLTARTAMTALAAGLYAQAEHAAGAALAAGEALSDPMTLGYALHTLAMVRHAAGHRTESLALIERGLAVVGAEPQLTDLRLMLYGRQIPTLAEFDRFTEAAEVLRLARSLGEQTGTPRLAGYAALSAELAYHQARWDDALAELEANSDASDIAALIAVHRDAGPAVDTYLNALPDDATSAYALLARALCAERTGQPAEALDILRIVLEPAYQGLEQRAMVLPVLARLAVAAGDVRTAEAAAYAATAAAQATQLPRARAAADWCVGLVEQDPNSVRSAADYLRRVGREAELGLALADVAVLWAERGRSGAEPDRDGALALARAAGAEAVAWYAEIGAAGDASWAVRRLRACGVRLRPVGASAGPGVSAVLTATERRVAELVALGKSNPDVAAELLLSRRTVETHVSHILAKVGARSRRELGGMIYPAVPDG